jgi:hypothetical protein
MSNLDELVPIPAGVNDGTSPCRERTMLEKFGRPGALSRQCSEPTLPFRNQVRFGVNVGPFRVSGHAYAVASLQRIFARLQMEHPDVHAAVKTAGMLCVRSRRPDPSRYSNHSWGCAIDLYFGSHLVAQGTPRTQRGFLILYPLFHAERWCWGGGFSGDSVDSMHFELSDEAIRSLPETHAASPELVAAAEYIADTGYDQLVEATA